MSEKSSWQPSAAVFWVMLILFSYLMWTGRQLDHWGRSSWIEAHATLALAVIAGIGFRFYFRRAEVQNATKAGRLFVLLLALLAFTGSVTECLLIAFAAGLDSAKRQIILHLPVGTYRLIPLLCMILFASIANFHPWFIASALTIMVLTRHRFLYGEEEILSQRSGTPSQQFSFMRNPVTTVVGWLLSAYYLYGQLNNSLSKCLSEPVCVNYPYEWLRMRCELTCAMTIANTDVLFDIALLVFVLATVRILSLFGSLVEPRQQEGTA